jgi:hypothetical protein
MAAPARGERPMRPPAAHRSRRQRDREPSYPSRHACQVHRGPAYRRPEAGARHFHERSDPSGIAPSAGPAYDQLDDRLSEADRMVSVQADRPAGVHRWVSPSPARRAGGGGDDRIAVAAAQARGAGRVDPRRVGDHRRRRGVGCVSPPRRPGGRRQAVQCIQLYTRGPVMRTPSVWWRY